MKHSDRPPPEYPLRRRLRNLTHVSQAARRSRRPKNWPPRWDSSPPLRTWSAKKSFSHTPAPVRQGSLKTTRLRGKCSGKNAATDTPSVQHFATKG